MSLDAWLLALHLLSAFAMVAATVLFLVVIFAVRRTDLPEQVVSVARLIPVGNAIVILGALGAAIFGVWLAIELDGTAVWDGWVIIAFVLWAVSAETGRWTGLAYEPSVNRAKELVAAGETDPDPQLRELAHTGRGLLLAMISTLALIVLLIDMIWKPGA